MRECESFDVWVMAFFALSIYGTHQNRATQVLRSYTILVRRIFSILFHNSCLWRKMQVLEDNKRKTNMIQRHQKDQETAENAYKSEAAERNRVCTQFFISYTSDCIRKKNLGGLLFSDQIWNLTIHL